MKRHYLYRHIRLDKEEPFYIGIGTVGKKACSTIQDEYARAYSKSGRSVFWKRIIEKTEYEVEILLESDDYEFIKQKEIEFIALYGRRDLGKGTLVNLTDGGDGNIGRVPSQETLYKLSIAKIGKKVSEETKLKQSLARKGKRMSEERKRLRKNNCQKGENHHASRLIINSQTGVFYNTVKEAAFSHNIKQSTLHNMLSGHRRNKTYLLYAESNTTNNYLKIVKNKEYADKKHTEETIRKLRESKLGKYKGKENARAIEIKDTTTNILYESVKEASEKLGINYKYLCDMLNPNNKKKNKTSLVYSNKSKSLNL